MFAGDEYALDSPHPDIMPALGLAPWNEGQFDYEDAEFSEPTVPVEVLDRVHRWSEAGRHLMALNDADRIDALAGDELAWERARSLIHASVETERARQRLSKVLPDLAAGAEVPMARVFGSARRTLSVEVRMAWLVPHYLLKPPDEPVFREALTEHEAARRLLEAYVILGNDCPRTRRPRLDRLLCAGEAEDQDETRLWLVRWAERKPETAAILSAA